MNPRRTKMREAVFGSGVLAVALCAVLPFAANAVEFAVPLEVAGINPAVKSIRVSCVAHGADGTIAAQGSQFAPVVAGAVKQTLTVKVDIPLAKVKPLAGYHCEADRAFEIDVTKLNPVPGKYSKPGPYVDEGMDIKALNLQANSVPKVSGKL
jgi:hypothetical protein